MEALLDRLFDKSQADAIRALWEDTSSRLLLQQEMGKELISTDKVINELPMTQLMLIATMSPFASSVNECYEVAGVLQWGMLRTDILPMITEHKGKELAFRCLISLGMFEGVMAKRCDRHGAPSPKFYRTIGGATFVQIGMKDVGTHFYQWENFIREMFI